MFYHDHAVGITRLNVYVGVAAGYLVQDAAGVGEWTLPGVAAMPQIPLVIQDKSFVPDDIATQDSKWDITRWGQPGDLWFPHVYETNQDPYLPNSPDGTNPVGRWDWGSVVLAGFPVRQPASDRCLGRRDDHPGGLHGHPGGQRHRLSHVDGRS